MIERISQSIFESPTATLQRACVVALVTLFTMPSEPARSQPSNCSATDTCYKRRQQPDRWEGIRDPEVSAEGLVQFLGLRLELPETVDRSAANYNLRFWLDTGRRLEVSVEQLARAYRLGPLKEDFQPGGTFTWPSAVLRAAEIDPATLLLSAWNREENVYFPVSLSSGEGAQRGSALVFHFVSRGAITGHARIFYEGEDGMLSRKASLAISKAAPGLVTLPWNGRSEGGEPCERGDYVVKLRATVVAETTEVATLERRFFWAPEILP